MNYLYHLYLTAAQNPYDVLWTVFGFLGQAIFGIRFLIQWLKTEKEGRVVVPVIFWYCSLFGGGISLAYAVHAQTWPLVLGQALPLPIYARNLYIAHRENAKKSTGR
jgi:lipid-A-disaccharide synthase-like uncharacterized protein